MLNISWQPATSCTVSQVIELLFRPTEYQRESPFFYRLLLGRGSSRPTKLVNQQLASKEMTMIDQPEIRFPPHIVVWPQFSGRSHAPQTSSPAARWVTPTSETLSTPHCSFQGFGLAGGTLEHFDMGGSPCLQPSLQHH